MRNVGRCKVFLLKKMFLVCEIFMEEDLLKLATFFKLTNQLDAISFQFYHL